MFSISASVSYKWVNDKQSLFIQGWNNNANFKLNYLVMTSCMRYFNGNLTRDYYVPLTWMFILNLTNSMTQQQVSNHGSP